MQKQTQLIYLSMGQIQGGRDYQASQQFGGVFIQLHKDGYAPGTQVTGTVHINLVKPYPGNRVFLKVKGEE
jgi:hypothetical protein